MIWHVETPIADDDLAKSAVSERAPDLTVVVAGRYDRALDAGSYLLCEHTNCVGIDVIAGEKITVNIKRRNGPTSFFVGGTRAEKLDEDFGVDVAE
jgi:hypothetical protein